MRASRGKKNESKHPQGTASAFFTSFHLPYTIFFSLLFLHILLTTPRAYTSSEVARVNDKESWMYKSSCEKSIVCKNIREKYLYKRWI